MSGPTLAVLEALRETTAFRVLPDPPLVTPTAYDKIGCNRCGQCCEGFTLPSPVELASRNALNDPKMSLWLGELEPIDSPFDEHRGFGHRLYRCPRFKREADGRGVCTIYDRRPYTCEGFPHYGVIPNRGRVTVPAHAEYRGIIGTDYEHCAWRVEIWDFEPVQGVLMDGELVTSDDVCLKIKPHDEVENCAPGDR